MNEHVISALRREAREAPGSGIVEVFNYGRGREGLIPLWAGEGDLPTPAFICEAAARALAAGETFYTYQRGLPELRATLARYHERIFGRKFPPERFFVTGGGMQAIQIAIAATAGSADEVVLLTPAWPNFAAAAGVAGAKPVAVPLDFDGTAWKLDFDKLKAAITPRTRSIFINSPSNPTGWTATEAELRALLKLSRERGLWIIADEVYSRFVFSGAERAPSFYDLIDDNDRVIFVNTFSKNWAMTGWRIGWLSVPPSLGDVIENLIQYSTSGVAAFMQRGAIAAVEEGEDFLRMQLGRAVEGRRIVCEGLGGSNRVRFAAPDGAFYLFFTIDGAGDTGKLGLTLVDEANIGIAPGSAFGPGGEAFMRLCFLRNGEDMSEATRRLRAWLKD
jgi:aspartate/methionine/tyrosine aminotransferase